MASNSWTNSPGLMLVGDKQPLQTSQNEICGISNFQIIAGEEKETFQLVDAQAFGVAVCDVTLAIKFRHTNPIAVMLVFTAYPALQHAIDVLRLQGDRILDELSEPPALVDLICEELQ